MTRTKLWKKNLLVSSLILALLLAACDLPAPTPTGAPGTETPTVTASPSPSASPTATATATATVTPTVPYEPGLGPNLLDNPGFEGPYRSVVYGEVNVAQGWEPFYVEGVPSDKPDQPLLGRPEYKPEDVYNYPDRVHGGELAQVWFSFFRPAKAGVYQRVEILPGFTYRFSVWVQSWSSFDDDPESELDTEDQRNASQWAIRIDPLGGVDPYAAGMVVCRLEGIEHYDQWAEFACEFESQSSAVTVFVENVRPWGLRNQNSYIDDAYLGCYDCPDVPFYTPTPIATPGPTVEPTYTPTPDPIIRPENADVNVVQLSGNFFPAITFATFGDHVIDWSITIREDIPAGNPIPIAALYRDPISGELWFSSDGHWQQHDVWDISIWVASEWFPWYANGAAWAGLTGYRWFGYPITDGDIPDLPYSN